MEKRQFNSIIKQYLVFRGFEKTAPNDYAIISQDGMTKFILRTPDQTKGFIIGAQFSDYGEYTGTFSKAVMKNHKYSDLLCFAKSRDFSEEDVLSAMDTVWNEIQPYISLGNAAIREHIDDWSFGCFSDRLKNEILSYLGLPTIDPYSKEYFQEQISAMKYGGMMVFPLEEYLSHQEYYDRFSHYAGAFTVNESEQTVRIIFPGAAKVFCRIITEDCDTHTEALIQSYVLGKAESIGAIDLTFSTLAPYWKVPTQGELSFQFFSAMPLSDIQQFFADTWQYDTADTQWSNVFCPKTAFLWISE